jgi:DNA (cytosine-5)-methyltransferase 1
MRVGSLFSGIGGIDLGLERAGMSVAWQCEADPYCRAVLRKRWPNVPCYEDVRLLDERVPTVDVLAGGFPCQPVSVAGKRLAQADHRWLWPEFARTIRLLRPRFVLVENVPGLLVRGFGDVLRDLAEAGYDAEWDCVSAADLGAPHLRRRVFLIGTRTMDHAMRGRHDLEDAESSAIAASNWQENRLSSAKAEPGNNGAAGYVADTEYRDESERSRKAGGNTKEWAPERGQPGRSDWWDVEPDVGRVAHGVPSRVDRLRTLGNAVVPQVAEVIGRRILAAARRFVLTLSR